MTPEKKLAPEAGGTDEIDGAAGLRAQGRSFFPWLVFGAVALLLLAIAIPNFQAARRRPGPRACPANMKTIGQALEAYLADHGHEALPRVTAAPERLLVEGGYLQQWPRCPGRGERRYLLRSRGPHHTPEVACSEHGNIAEYNGGPRRASDLL